MNAWNRRTGRLLLVLALILSQLWLVSGAGAQIPMGLSTQFDVTGFIQAATLDAPGDVLAGGTITVNNQVITVPRNTILQMPAAALTWQEVFTQAPAPYGPTQTGLAFADTPTPAMPYEAHVVGNRVGDTYIAGLIFLAQHSLQSGQGYINFINYSTGEFRVGGVIGDGTTGERVKINDPLGRFAPLWTPDARFTIDENNPTVRTGTGYPMCIPRGTAAGVGDPFCPDANRVVAGVVQSTLTMPPVTAAILAGGAAIAPETRDGRLMAPFKVGDYVTYSGIIVQGDPTLVAAYQVIGNVGIFTDPTSLVHYIATDVMLLGTGGLTVAGKQEATVRTRFEGFSTLASTDSVNPTLVNLWGVDVDCTAAESLRSWGTIDVDTGPPTGAVLGRWRFRPPSKVIALPPAGTFLPATREMRSTIRGVTPVSIPTADPGGSLTAGQYQAPIFEFLFPENIAVGSPVVPNNFETFPFLAQGSGPLGGAGSPTVGQLSPWPGDPGLLTAVSCGPVGPPPPPPPPGTPLTATATAAPSPAFVNNVITLSATASDPTATFLWTVTASAAPITLTGATNPQATFLPTAPGDYSFSVTATTAAGSVSVPVTVSVLPAGDTITVLLAQYRITKQRLTVDATSTDPTSVLFMQAFDATGVALTGRVQLAPVPGVGLEVILVGIGRPATVVVTSNHGDQKTVAVTFRTN